MEQLKRIIIFFQLLLPFVSVKAYDFSVDGFYYNIISDDDELVEVTYKYIGYGESSILIGDQIIPEKVTYNGKTYMVSAIGEYAFNFCTKLKSVVIPSSVTTIGDRAFYECNSLTHVNIPTSITDIGAYAFHFCYKLETIHIPESVQNIGHLAFCKCTKLNNIDVSEDNVYYSSMEGVLYSKDYSTLITYPLDKTDKNFNIPSTVKSITSMAFDGCSNLTSVYIPESVIDLGLIWCIFTDCPKLAAISVDSNNSCYKAVDGVLYSKDGTIIYRCPEAKIYSNNIIKDNVRIIGIGAFNGCRNIASMIIPNSVEIIDHYAFMGCENLKKVEFPETTINIGSYTFQNCTGLTEFNMPKSVVLIEPYYGTFNGCSNLENVIIESQIESIGEVMFNGCTNLKNVVLPNSLRTIEAAAFNHCISLTSFNIPNSVISIGDQAYRWCSGLTSVEIPKSIEYIGNHAFIDCGNLSTVYYKTTEPITVNNNIFDNSLYEKATLYVEVGGLRQASSTSPWMYFNNIKESGFGDIRDVIADFNMEAPIEVYNLNGTKVANCTNNLPTGIFIIRQGNVNRKVVVK